jgi:hypothetical protein
VRRSRDAGADVPGSVRAHPRSRRVRAMRSSPSIWRGIYLVAPHRCLAQRPRSKTPATSAPSPAANAVNALTARYARSVGGPSARRSTGPQSRPARLCQSSATRAAPTHNGSKIARLRLRPARASGSMMNTAFDDRYVGAISRPEGQVNSSSL